MRPARPAPSRPIQTTCGARCRRARRRSAAPSARRWRSAGIPGVFPIFGHARGQTSSSVSAMPWRRSASGAWITAAARREASWPLCSAAMRCPPIARCACSASARTPTVSPSACRYWRRSSSKPTLPPARRVRLARLPARALAAGRLDRLLEVPLVGAHLAPGEYRRCRGSAPRPAASTPGGLPRDRAGGRDDPAGRRARERGRTASGRGGTRGQRRARHCQRW